MTTRSHLPNLIALAVALLSFSASPARTAVGSCSALLVKHPSTEYSGRYSLTPRVINGAPVYRHENYQAPEGSNYQFLYTYRHAVRFTASGYVWVMQPVTPDPDTWLANNYADSEEPWGADWGEGITVECEETRKRSAGDSHTADLMILYTAAAESEALDQGTTIQALARRRLQALNDVFYESHLAQRVRLIHLGSTRFDEEARRRTIGDSEQRRNPLAYVSALRGDLVNGDDNNPGITSGNADAVQAIHETRELLGADLVSVLVASKGIPCGIGASAIHPRGDGTFKKDAYSAVAVRCHAAPALAMAHEIGHNFGLQHDRGTLRQPNATGYNYGYVDSRNKIFSVMAYIGACAPDCKLVPHWSSPEVNYRLCRGGECTNIATGTEKTNNRKAIREAFEEVVHFYTAGHTSRLAPSHLDIGSIEFPGGSHRTVIQVYNLTSLPLPVLRIYLSGTHEGDVTFDDGAGDACRVGEEIPPHGSCSLTAMVRPSQVTSNAYVIAFIQLEPTGSLGAAITWSTVHGDL